MAAFGWRRWWWVVAVVLLPSAPEADSRNVTHEDIRDAMLSLVHMFRTSEDKLERHEYREKALGDQLKKTLIGLEKRHRALEPLKGMISRLDERLSNVETILLQKEEREKATQKNTNDALEAIQKSLEALARPPASDNLTTKEDAATKEEALAKRLDVTDTKLDAVKQEIENLKNSLGQEALRAMCLSLGPEESPLGRHISEAEKLLNKYEVKLSEYGNATKVQTDFVPLSEVTLADEAWHSKMTEVMERQEKEVQKVQRLLADAEGLWKELPRREDLQRATNRTLDAVQAARETAKEASDQAATGFASRLRELDERLAAANGEIQRVLTQGNTDSERAYTAISKGYDTLLAEVQAIANGGANGNVLIQTADDVIAVKKRIEYGVHQILLELGSLVKAQGALINRTMHERFAGIESTIVEKQATSLAALSGKVETEMAQVWRQIAAVYQQLAASKVSMDKLTEQTEIYVNGSSTKLQTMKETVGLISGRMEEVDVNLNYLLGRLSLVTQEFSQLRVGLDRALDRVKGTIRAVHDNSAQLPLDDSAGPHNITSAEST